TVNEVVNGLLSCSDGREVPMLGVVPGGSANVFARAMGLPVNPVEATHHLLHAIEDGHSRRVGLGLVDAAGGPRRWFTFDGGLGLFALRSLAAPTVLRHLRQALSGRGNQRGRKMVRDDDVAWVRVTASQPTRVQVDGDLLGEFTSVEYRAVPNALTIAV